MGLDLFDSNPPQLRTANYSSVAMTLAVYSHVTPMHHETANTMDRILAR
jgi:hypothetical protein